MEIFKNSLFLALLASFLFAGCALSLKIVSGTGPLSNILIWIGLAVVVTGFILKITEGGEFVGSFNFISFSILCGLFYALGMACVTLALNSGGQISLVSPIYNVNTLWIMLAGLFFFKEAEKLSVPYALTGGAFIIIGGTILGFAERR